VAVQRSSTVDKKIDFLVDEHSKNPAISPHEESKASEVSKVKKKMEKVRDSKTVDSAGQLARLQEVLRQAQVLSPGTDCGSLSPDEE